MNLGYDYIVIETNDIVSFLKETKKHQLTLFHLHQLDALRYSFYVPIYQRYITSSMHLPIQKSIGLLHYLFLIFKFPQIIFTLAFISTLFILPHYIYDYKITGSLSIVNNQLQKDLNKQIQMMHPKLTYPQINKLYDHLKRKYQSEIDYLNVYQKGSVLHVEYTPASHNQKTVLKYQDYIAKKDGIIRQLDVKQGNVLVKVNQYVKKGDVLISHQIEDTKQQIKMIPTLGSVEAYTYQYIEASSSNVKDKEEIYNNGERKSELMTTDNESQGNISERTNNGKLEQFQSIISEVVSNALKENTGMLGKEVSEIVSDNVIKEMDYLMHIREKQEEERFKKLDETIRSCQLHRKESAKIKRGIFSKIKKIM